MLNTQWSFFKLLGRLRRESATLTGYLAFILVTFFGDGLSPGTVGGPIATVMLVGLFCVMLWLAFAVVRHAEGLATLLGEPYGTLILTLSVIGIEVALISAVMITGDNKPALARDTMFAVLMIVLNGLVGLSLVLGGLRYRLQNYNLQGANAYLAVLIPLAVLGLILPSFTQSAPGGELSELQGLFLISLSLILYGIFLAIQTVTHSDIFQEAAPLSSDDPDAHHHFVVESVTVHSLGLVAAMLPIVMLSKSLAVYVDFGIESANAPVALGGFLIAALVLTPEGLSAIQAAQKNQLQRAVNICLGSALATIALTIPAVLAIGWAMDRRVELGLGNAGIVELSATLLVSIVTFASPRTNVLLGAVHLALFAAYIMLIFDGSV